MIQDVVAGNLVSSGVQILFDSAISNVVCTNNDSKLLNLKVGVGNSGESREINDVDCLIWAIGRSPNTDHLDLQQMVRLILV